jgi:prepilin-type N-terminal cleavage/methylation domain-containing protein
MFRPDDDHRLRPPLRRGFTLIELLVVIAIMVTLASMALVVYARTGESARIAGTKALLTILHSAVTERVEALRRFNIRPLSRTAQDDVNDANKVYQYKLLYRGAFPQRLQDLYGSDGDPMTRGNNAPLFSIVEKKLGVTFSSGNIAQYEQSVSSSELLYLALTEGTSFGLPPLDLDLIDSKYVADTDSDGLLEFIDGWGNPIRFYNAPTGLLRPGGNVYDGMMGNPTPVTRQDYNNARILIRTLPEFLPTNPMMNPNQVDWNDYTSPLNIDPDDPIGEFDAFFLRKNADLKEENFMEMWFHAVNTYHTPLIVSAGPDGALGLYEPNDTSGTNSRNRLGVISSVAEIYDNLTNLQRGGF